MKYIVIDQRKDGTGDIFTTECSNAPEAIQEARKEWEHLTGDERKARVIYVLESVNPDENAPDHFDGNEVFTAGQD